MRKARAEPKTRGNRQGEDIQNRTLESGRVRRSASKPGHCPWRRCKQTPRLIPSPHPLEPKKGAKKESLFPSPSQKAIRKTAKTQGHLGPLENCPQAMKGSLFVVVSGVFLTISINPWQGVKSRGCGPLNHP